MTSMPTCGLGVWWNLYQDRYEQKETAVRPVVELEIDLLDWLKFRTAVVTTTTIHATKQKRRVLTEVHLQDIMR